MRRVLSGLWHRLSLRLFGESRRTFAPLPPLSDTGVSSTRAMRVLELRPDLRDMFPFALCPPDRGRLLEWWKKELPFGVSADECLKLLHEMDARPDRGLAVMFRLQPGWQAAVPLVRLSPGGEGLGVRGTLPNPATCETHQSPNPNPPHPCPSPPGERGSRPESPSPLTPLPQGRGGPAEALKSHLIARYQMPARWLRSASLSDSELAPPVDPARGVNVVAHLGYPSGLQQVALGLLDALARAGIPVSLRNLPVTVNDTPPPDHLGLEPYGTTLYVAAVNSFPDEWYGRAGLWMRPGVRRIAVWYWEMETVPPEWIPRMQWPDEVWAPTTFLADTFRKYVSRPVVPMLPGVELPAFAPLPRARFGLRDGRFTFLFSFDMASTLERKNPLGLIRAFRMAFRPDEPVDLVVKVSRGESDPAAFARLTAEAASASVILLNETLPREELLALFAACDCYVSLHRAEGFGLGMAEAMLLGKPVIASGYSGNLDFTTAETAYLVRCGRTVLDSATGPYPVGGTWGEPDLAHAAELMRRVHDHRTEAAEVAARGQRAAADLLSLPAFARRVAAALVAPARGG